MTVDEQARTLALTSAQDHALELFDEVIDRGWVRAGRGERELSDQIRELANERFGVRRFWHKRIVRSGVNTLEPYRANPPDRVLEADDIVFFDFGPIFDQFEADIGRTFVLGDDPVKHQIAADLPLLWEQGRRHFLESPAITGAELFAYVLALIDGAGWGHGASHAGHLVGEFPHERINGDERDCYITAGNDTAMRRLDPTGRPCHWILEIHLVDRERGFGGFFEQLLDL